MNKVLESKRMAQQMFIYNFRQITTKSDPLQQTFSQHPGSQPYSLESRFIQLDIMTESVATLAICAEYLFILLEQTICHQLYPLSYQSSCITYCLFYKFYFYFFQEIICIQEFQGGFYYFCFVYKNIVTSFCPGHFPFRYSVSKPYNFLFEMFFFYFFQRQFQNVFYFLFLYYYFLPFFAASV